MADDVLHDLDAPPSEEVQSAMDKLIEARKAREALERQEQVQEPGATSLQGKGELLSAREAKAHPANKGYHLRWVNTSVPEKIQVRKLEGYEVVPESEGGKKLGTEYILMRLPVAKADAKKKALKEKGRVWLAAHKGEMQKTAEEVAKILRNQYGFTSSEASLLVEE